MIKKITLLTLLVVSSTIFSQSKIKGNGLVSTIKTELKAFNKIAIENDFKVLLIKSNTPSIEIETDENLHDAIKFNITDSILVLNTNNKLKPKKTLNITIFCTDILNEITLKNNSKIETLNMLNVSNMSLKINDYAKANLSVKSNNFKLASNNASKIQLRSKSKLNIESKSTALLIGGSSNTDITIRTDSLHINLKDKASLDIEGTATNLNTILKDNTNFKGKNLNVKEAIVAIKNSSELSINTSEKIIIHSSEKSEIELYGNPKILLEKFTNSSKLHKKELN